MGSTQDQLAPFTKTKGVPHRVREKECDQSCHRSLNADTNPLRQCDARRREAVVTVRNRCSSSSMKDARSEEEMTQARA